MFNLITSGFSWLFGNSKAADAAVSSLDKIYYSDEEKADAKQKILNFKIEYAKATQNQSIARRIIAVIVSGLWALLNIVSLLAGYFDRSEGSYSQFIAQAIADNINSPFIIIIGFYFAAHVVGKYKNE